MNNVHPIFQNILAQIDSPMCRSLDKEENGWGVKKELLQRKVASGHYRNLDKVAIDKIVEGLLLVVLKGIRGIK